MIRNTLGVGTIKNAQWKPVVLGWLEAAARTAVLLAVDKAALLVGRAAGVCRALGSPPDPRRVIPAGPGLGGNVCVEGRSGPSLFASVSLRIILTHFLGQPLPLKYPLPSEVGTPLLEEFQVGGWRFSRELGPAHTLNV